VTDETQPYAQRIHRVVAAVAARVTPDEVADALVREIAATLGAVAASVFLFDETRQRIVRVRAVGYPESVIERWSTLSIDGPLLGPVHRGQPLFARSRLADSRFDASLSQQFGDGAGFVVPMQAGGRMLGCLGVSFDRVRDFPAEEREFIMALAGHCAQTFERARLFAAEREARAAADTARRQLEAVLDQLPVGVSVVGADGSVRLNAAAGAIWAVDIRRTQLPPAERRELSMRRLDGSSYGAGELPITRALAGHAVDDEELIIRRTDGSERRVCASATPVRDADGVIRSAVAVFSDVTAQRQVEAELRASERRHAAVLRATDDVIWEVETASDHMHWSPALTRVFGHAVDAADKYPAGRFQWWVDHVHPDDRAAVLEGYSRAEKGGSDTWVGEYRFRHADGSWVPTFDRCVFERDARGKVTRVVGAITDVSEQHRLLDELRAAVLVRDDFLSCAGHELRTPLAALGAQLLGLKQLPLDDARRSHKLAAAERQVGRLTTLVDELLDVSRIVHGKLRLEREEVDLALVAREAALRLVDDFQRGGTPLEIDAPAPVVGRWDRLRIDLVVTNLLTNALRYGERRPVKLTVADAGAHARLVVEDHGLGIRPEDQERIFERFVRAVPSRQYGGLGVGLWLSRQVVEAHGGRLAVQSEAGVGSRFTVELPKDGG
jgi:PAS domain S-box-containing protein